MNMKKLSLAVLAACLAVAPLKSRAVEIANSAPHPKDTAGSVEGLTYQGVKPIRIPVGGSTTSAHVGPGFLDAICPYLGTAGNYSMAFDEADGGGLLAGPTSTSALTYALSPQVFTGGTANGSAGIYSMAQNYQGCWVPVAPVKFLNGLYVQVNATGHATIVYAHCSDGTNPCVMP